MDIEELRKQENIEIMQHIKAIKDIIAVKCKRCKNIYTCQGCEFGPGEMLWHLETMEEQMLSLHLELQPDDYKDPLSDFIDKGEPHDR